MTYYYYAVTISTPYRFKAKSGPISADLKRNLLSEELIDISSMSTSNVFSEGYIYFAKDSIG